MKNKNEKLGLVALVSLIVLVAAIALFITPYKVPSLPVNDTGNMTAGQAVDQSRSSFSMPLFMIGSLMFFVGVFLLITKVNVPVMYLVGAVSMFSLAYAIINTLSLGGLLPDADGVSLFAVCCGLCITALAFVHPEWYTIDLAGVLACAGIASLSGYMLGPLPCIVLLFVLLIYDYIAVYKTKHMIKMANDAIRLKLPMLFIVPLRKGYSFRKEGKPIEAEPEGAPKKERSVYMLGFGDAVFPTALAVSAKVSILPTIGFVNLPSVCTIIGTAVGMAVLMVYMSKKSGGAPGLPFLCTGAIGGFAVGYVLNMLLLA